MQCVSIVCSASPYKFWDPQYLGSVTPLVYSYET